MKRGVLYIVSGSRHNANCRRSAATLRAQGFRGRITVVTDRPDSAALRALGCRIVDARIPGLDDLASVKHWRRRMYECTDDEQCVYLDADTFILRPFSGIWSALKRGPLGMALDFHATLGEALAKAASEKKGGRTERELTRRRCLANAPYFNSGVIVWRRTPAAKRFFDAWQEEWAPFGDTDQFAAARALRRLRMTPVTLPSIFNDDGIDNWSLTGTVIFHYWPWKHENRFSWSAHLRRMKAQRRSLSATAA